MNPTTIRWEQIQKSKRGEETNILIMLWQRKLYYLVGFILTFLIGLFNIGLGSHVEIAELIEVSLGCSFIFGFIIYLFIKEPDRLKKEGRTIILTKEGLIHFGLPFGMLIIASIIRELLGYFS